MNASTHTTSGTERRAAHQLSGGGLVFRLGDEIEELRQDLKSSSGHRSAKTLAKSGSLRVTLVVLEANATLEPESTDGEATIQVLDGRLRVQTDGSVHELGPGELVVLEQNLREQIQAPERAAFLITVVWPEGKGAWSQEAAAGRL
jgi:quercetin dioxygenase-like cupin family protein